jgi:hypothetical protein
VGISPVGWTYYELLLMAKGKAELLGAIRSPGSGVKDYDPSFLARMG